MMMHNHNLWYLLLTHLSRCRWPSPEKSPRDILMRRPAQYFATVLNRLTSTNLPKTLNYIQYRLLCVTQATNHAIKVSDESWKSTKDLLKRRPAQYFVTVLNILMSTNLPKTLNFIQCRLLCVTQATYRAIKVINGSWKIPKDILMRRPATCFVTVLNRLVSTNLPKTLIYI